MAEYIEREALLKDIEEAVVFTVPRNQPSPEVCGAQKVINRIKEALAADVVEVYRGEDSVLSELENDYKDFKKIKTHLAQIIVGGKIEAPYYSILWWDNESKEYNIGYSSYCLNYVRKWLELVFDVDETADVVEAVRCKDCKHSSQNTPDGLHWCDEHERGCLMDEDFCSYGERRADNAAD